MKTNSLKKLMPCLIMAVAQIAFISAYAADDGADNKGQLSASDYKFVKEAACGGMFEVNTGNLAAANSSNTGVQQFGQQMVRDHGKAGDQLKQIATSKGATLPSALSGKMQREVDHLSKLSGPEFDKAYMAEMVKAHKMDEKAFKHAAENLQDPDLKNFAATTLQMVQAHLKMAEDLNDSIKHELSLNN